MRFPQSFGVPLFWPGVLVSVGVGLILSGPVGRALGIRRALAWALVVSLGMVVAATLTPIRGAIDFGASGSGTCDFSRLGLAPLRELLHFNDTSLNVVLFVPLGACLGLVARSRRKVALIAAAIALPFGIEVTQLLLPSLDRSCQSADVIDNLTGLAIGLVLGTAAGWLWSVVLPEVEGQAGSEEGGQAGSGGQAG